MCSLGPRDARAKAPLRFVASSALVLPLALLSGLISPRVAAAQPSVATHSSPAASLAQAKPQAQAAKPAETGAAAAVSQSAQPAPTPAFVLPDKSAVIGLLDQVISWYRGRALEHEIVSEPAEILYASQNRPQAAEILKLAFDYGRAEATAQATFQPAEAKHPEGVKGSILAHPELIQNRRAEAEAEVARFKAQIASLQAQIKASPRRQRTPLQQQLATAQNELELASARVDFLATMSAFQEGTAHGGNHADSLLAQIDELERTLPAESTEATATANAPEFQLAAPEPSGLIPQFRRWLDMRHKINVLGRRIDETKSLEQTVKQSVDTIVNSLKQINQNARALAGQGETEQGVSPSVFEARRKQFQSLLEGHKVAADALLPLTKMTLLLSRYESNLAAWQDESRRRAAGELYGFAMRALALALTLAFLAVIGIAFRRVAFRYIEDSRRRAQMLQMRSVVLWIVAAIVLALEFVSEVGSLATVIGLATAGIAVALQDVIVSIAGYFRMGGRFGIKVGDWIEVQGVVGEVIDISLTRLTMLELTVEGGEREPTGRIAVLPNAVVFREKFANRAYGSGLTWDEIELLVSPECDYRLAEKRLMEAVEEVFARYREAARRESHEMERRFNVRVEEPRPQSRITVGVQGIKLEVRYPVNARKRTQVADEITRRLLDSLKDETAIRLVPQMVANIQPPKRGSDGVQAPTEPAFSTPTPAQPARAPLSKA